jgi:hypothetical protein
MSDDCTCEECGCTGNETCGAEPLGEDCALDECGICPCCRVIGKEANVKRWKTNQGDGLMNHCDSTKSLTGVHYPNRRGAND